MWPTTHYFLHAATAGAACSFTGLQPTSAARKVGLKVAIFFAKAAQKYVMLDHFSMVSFFLIHLNSSFLQFFDRFYSFIE